MSTPTLSVLMGNYNHAHYLVESIPSILKQSFRPKEFIIIDDASTDNSVEIIEGFAKDDPVIRFCKNEENLGTPSTFARAYKLMTGDYFFLPAADDLVLPGFFEKSMAILEKFPSAGFCSAVSRKIDDNGNELGTAPEPPYISKTSCYVSPEKALEYALKNEVWYMYSTVIWRQKALESAGGFPDEAGNFLDGFMGPLLSLNNGACFIPEPLGIFRVLPGSISAPYRKTPQLVQGRIEHITKLMKSPAYANKFPESYVKMFEKIGHYEQAAMALQNWQESMGECNRCLDYALKSSFFFDKWILRGNTILGGIQHRFLKLYLFARTRKFSWSMIHRIFLRLMKKFKKKQE